MPRAALADLSPPPLPSALAQRTSAMSDNLVCVRNSLTDIMEADAGHVPRWVLNLYATDASQTWRRAQSQPHTTHLPLSSLYSGTRRRPSVRT